MKSMSKLTAQACLFLWSHSEDSRSAPQMNAVGLKWATPHYFLVAMLPSHSLLSIGIGTTLSLPCHFSPGWQPEPPNDLWTCSCPWKHTVLTKCHSASSCMCRKTQTCCLAPLASPGSPCSCLSLDLTLHPLTLAPFQFLEYAGSFLQPGLLPVVPSAYNAPVPCTLPAWAPSHLQTLNIVGLYSAPMERASLLGLRFPVTIVWPTLFALQNWSHCVIYTCLLAYFWSPLAFPAVSCCLLPPPGPLSGQGFVFSDLQCILSPKFSSWCMIKAPCLLVE